MIFRDKLEDWKTRWLHMGVIMPYHHLCLPASPPVAIANMWLAMLDLGEEWLLVLDPIA